MKKTFLWLLLFLISGVAQADTPQQSLVQQSKPENIFSSPETQLFNNSIETPVDTNSLDKRNEPLPVDQAFPLILSTNTASPYIEFRLPDSYLLYVDSIRVDGARFEKPLQGRDHFDEALQKNRPVLEKTTQIHLTIPKNTTSVVLHYQGCQEQGICYPPVSQRISIQTTADGFSLEKETSSSSLPTQSSSKETTSVNVVPSENRFASFMQDRNPLVMFAIFLGIGIALGVTPCILPMIPILLAMISGAQATPRKSVVLSGVYVFAHALTFAGLGVVAALFGAGFSATFQHPIFLVGMGMVLTALGVSMMHATRIQMPAFVQNWASQKGQGGSIVGVFTMGVLSSLILGPCVAPPLMGVVLYISATGNALTGATALFAIGLGMGVPLLLAATGFKQISSKLTGAASEWITKGMGAGLIVVGSIVVSRYIPWVWLVSIPSLVLLLPLPKKNIKFAGAAVTALIIGFVVQPFSSSNVDLLNAQKVTTVAELNTALKNDDVVVVDFHADWCVECKRMSSTTFVDEDISKQLSTPNTQFVQVDITHNTSNDTEILNAYGLIGPPAVLFFKNGEEIKSKRLIGYENSEDFSNRLNAVLTCQKEVKIC